MAVPSGGGMMANLTAPRGVLSPMVSQLKRYTADHRYLLEAAARRAGFAAPVAVSLDAYYEPLLSKARKGELLPVDGVLIRDWDPDNRRWAPGVQLGMRLYEIEGIRFVQVHANFNNQQNCYAYSFVAVDRKDYRRLFRVAERCRRSSEPPSPPPVLPQEQADLLWKNTIDYLDPANLRRIQAYGGRPKRGVLLTGAPGNGKTMACRWVWEECRQRGWEWRMVTPDSFLQARTHDNVQGLFEFTRCGVVFFDDMDLALRDRDTIRETEDQAILLSALDGLKVNEGVVVVFTTNCALELIDRAFKRPGRIDVALHFKAPDAGLRRQLVERWHEDIRQHLDVPTLVASTDGYSFAEIEELKNLLVMHWADSGSWNWGWALKQFDINRHELASQRRRRVGFEAAERVANGSANGV